MSPLVLLQGAASEEASLYHVCGCVQMWEYALRRASHAD